MGGATHGQMIVAAPGVQQLAGADLSAAAGIARAVTIDVRSQQRVEAQFALQRLVHNLKPGVNQQDGAMGVGANLLDEPISALALGIGHAVEEAGPLRVLDLVLEVDLFFVAERFAVGDEKLEVARVGLIDGGIINLVDNAVAQREPDPATGVIGRAESLLGAGGPARFDARRAEGRCVVAGRHAGLFRAAASSPANSQPGKSPMCSSVTSAGGQAAMILGSRA